MGHRTPLGARATLLAALTLGAAAALFACSSGDTETGGFTELNNTGGGSATASSSDATTATTTTATTSSGQGGASTSSTSSTSTSAATSGSGGDACNDIGPGEPNDTEATAHVLPAMDDCDPSPVPSFDAVLDGTSDVDWYKYAASDASFCSVDPSRQFTVFGLARLCKFAKCNTGTTNVTCNGNAAQATSPNGNPGCCDAKSLSMGIDCSGTLSDDATVYIRVDTGGDACVDYSLAYHY